MCGPRKSYKRFSGFTSISKICASCCMHFYRHNRNDTLAVRRTVIKACLPLFEAAHLFFFLPDNSQAVYQVAFCCSLRLSFVNNKKRHCENAHARSRELGKIDKALAPVFQPHTAWPTIACRLWRRSDKETIHHFFRTSDVFVPIFSGSVVVKKLRAVYLIFFVSASEPLLSHAHTGRK